MQDGALLRVPVVERALGRPARISDSQFSTVYTVDDCDGDGRRDLVTASDTYSLSQLWLARSGSYVPVEELRSRRRLRCGDRSVRGVLRRCGGCPWSEPTLNGDGEEQRIPLERGVYSLMLHSYASDAPPVVATLKRLPDSTVPSFPF